MSKGYIIVKALVYNNSSKIKEIIQFDVFFFWFKYDQI